MKQKVFSVVLVLALLLCMAACSQSAPSAAPSGGEGSSMDAETPDSEDAAQTVEFTAETLDGQQLDQTVFSDAKLTMVNLWATWCPPCIMELPDLAELAEEAASMEVQVLGIVHDGYDIQTGGKDEEVLEIARSLVEQTGVKYPVLIPGKELMDGLLKDVEGFPTTWFIDGQGNIIGESVLGSNSKDGWMKILQERLAEVTE
ncbi:MAG: TlpA family protein disulfide reductase [Oscillospiraceae bacterium]|nr:TlpA family protein disulfide reductase [Oscillospiraceae bacterium]